MITQILRDLLVCAGVKDNLLPNQNYKRKFIQALDVKVLQITYPYDPSMNVNHSKIGIKTATNTLSVQSIVCEEII